VPRVRKPRVGGPVDEIEDIQQGLQDLAEKLHDEFSPLDEEFDEVKPLIEATETALAETKVVVARRLKRHQDCGKSQAIAFGLAVWLGATWSPFKGKGRR